MAKEALAIEGRDLGEVLAHHHSLAAYYDEVKCELHTISKYIELMIDKRIGELNYVLKEQSQIDHSDRSIDKMVRKDQTYITLNLSKLEVDELLDKARGYCRNFEQMGYTLTNIVKAYESELKDITIVLN